MAGMQKKAEIKVAIPEEQATVCVRCTSAELVLALAIVSTRQRLALFVRCSTIMSSTDDREHIPPSFVLVSNGKVPEDGAEDPRNILQGRQGAPAVSVWPRLMIRRKWRLHDGSDIAIDCGVQKGPTGPVYFCESSSLKDSNPVGMARGHKRCTGN